MPDGRNIFRKGLVALLLSSGLLLPGPWIREACAVSISPVLIELTPTQRVVTIAITNPDARPLSFQVSTRAWTQVDGLDRYDEGDDLVVVPPIADIAAGGTQIFRVTSRRIGAPQESAWRLIFEDISDTAATDATRIGVNLRINHDLPVFAGPGGNPPDQLLIAACPEPAPAGCIRFDNAGARYLQLRSVRIEAGTWQREFPSAMRVLAGAWRRFEFDLPAGIQGPLRVIATIRQGRFSAELPAGRR